MVKNIENVRESLEGSNTLINLGNGVTILEGNGLKSLIAGMNITLTSTSTTITIASTSGGTGNVTSEVTLTSQHIVVGNGGTDVIVTPVQIDSSGNITNITTINGLNPSNIVTSITNSGTGGQALVTGSGNSYIMKELTAASGVTLTSDENQIFISADGSAGGNVTTEVTLTSTAVVVGNGGTDVIVTPVLIDPSGNITGVTTINTLNVANFVTSISNAGTGDQALVTGSGHTYVVKRLTAGSGVILSSDANQVTISATGIGGGNVTTEVTLTSTNIVVGNGTTDVIVTPVQIDGSGNITNILSLNGTAITNFVTSITNSGTGDQALVTGSGNAYVVKELTAGSNIVLTSDANQVTIALANTGGSNIVYTHEAELGINRIITGYDGADNFVQDTPVSLSQSGAMTNLISINGTTEDNTSVLNLCSYSSSITTSENACNFCSPQTAIVNGQQSGIICSNGNLGNSTANTYLSALMTSSTCNLSPTTSLCEGITVLSSRNVKADESNQYSLVMGYSASGSPSSANRSIVLQSQGGNVIIAGTLTQNHIFSDTAYMWENHTPGTIPVGYIVALDHETGKVRQATEKDKAFGIVSAFPTILCQADSFHHANRYDIDQWGAPVYDEILDPQGQKVKVKRLNKKFDPSLPHVKREDRPAEYTKVGVHGVLHCRIQDKCKIGDFLVPDDNGHGKKSKKSTNIQVVHISQPYDKNLNYGIARVFLR
jgi:hypothetical protein